MYICVYIYIYIYVYVYIYIYPLDARSAEVLLFDEFMHQKAPSAIIIINIFRQYTIQIIYNKLLSYIGLYLCKYRYK